MKKTAFSTFCMAAVLMFGTSIQAQTSIDFQSPRENIGGSFLLSNTLVKMLDKKGWDINFKSLNNCALAKSNLQNSRTPLVMMWENVFIAEDKNNMCHTPPPSAEEVVGVHALSPYYVCVRPDSSITANNILNSKESYTIAVFDDVLIPQIVKKLQEKVNSNYKPVFYKNPRTAFLAGETDMYIGAHGAAMMKENTAKCFFNSGTSDLNGTKSLGKALGEDKFVKILYYYTVARNLSKEQMQKLRADMKEIMKTEEWKKTTSRYLIPEFDDLDSFSKTMNTYLK